jgi:hypothetical protein
VPGSPPIRSPTMRTAGRRPSCARAPTAVWRPPGSTSPAAGHRDGAATRADAARGPGPAWLVLLDLRELMSMDRAGVQTIVEASLSARRLGRRLVLLRGVPDVDRMFTLTRRRGRDRRPWPRPGAAGPSAAAFARLVESAQDRRERPRAQGVALTTNGFQADRLSTAPGAESSPSSNSRLALRRQPQPGREQPEPRSHANPDRDLCVARRGHTPRWRLAA